MTILGLGWMRLLCSLALLATAASAQWLNYPTPGVPRNPDGKPDLAARPPHAADGKPLEDFEKTLEEETQHRDGLAEPVERAIIQTLPTESDWSSSCCVAF